MFIDIIIRLISPKDKICVIYHVSDIFIGKVRDILDTGVGPKPVSNRFESIIYLRLYSTELFLPLLELKKNVKLNLSSIRISIGGIII